jgi:hypothetical protein
MLDQSRFRPPTLDVTVGTKKRRDPSEWRPLTALQLITDLSEQIKKPIQRVDVLISQAHPRLASGDPYADTGKREFGLE